MNWNEMRWMNLNWIEMVWKMWLICEAVCRLAVDAGPCRDAYNRWYFDPERSTCVPFVFGGCAGNMNRFKNFESCINFCSAGIQDAERNQQHSRNGPFTSHLHIFFFTFSLFHFFVYSHATLPRFTHPQNRQQLKKFGNRFNCSFDWCSVAALLILHKNILRRLAMLSDYWCSVATLFFNSTNERGIWQRCNFNWCSVAALLSLQKSFYDVWQCCFVSKWLQITTDAVLPRFSNSTNERGIWQRCNSTDAALPRFYYYRRQFHHVWQRCFVSNWLERSTPVNCTLLMQCCHALVIPRTNGESDNAAISTDAALPRFVSTFPNSFKSSGGKQFDDIATNWQICINLHVRCLNVLVRYLSHEMHSMN